MLIQRLKRDIKQHRPIDWFALFVFASVAFVVLSVLSSKIEEFKRDMDTDAKLFHAQILQMRLLKEHGFIGE